MKTKSTLFVLLLTSLSNITPAKAQVDVNDSLALVDLYNSMDGPNWDNHENWLTGPVSTWFGITLEENRVIKIDLRGIRLWGSIPASIGNLAKLRYLNLFENFLNSIPSEIGNLANLSYLNMSFDNLNSIPPEIGNLANLEYLNLTYNQLSSLPPEIGNLANLENLYLSSNQLSSIPPEIGNMANLKYLDLTENQLTSIPPEIGNLASLEYLNLLRNQLSSLPPEIGNLANLSELVLFYNQLSSLPPEIGNLANLSRLDLAYNQLNSLPPEIGNMANLSSLVLSLNALISIPSEIGNLANLSYLDLHANRLSNIPAEIGKLANLTALYLDGNQLSNIPPEIGNLSNLHFLYLSSNRLSTLPSEIGNLPIETEIALGDNHLTFEGLELIAQKFEFAYYNPQANIPVHQIGNALSVSAGGTLSNNTYTWFMVGQPGHTTISGDSVFSPLQDGDYYAEIVNSICTQLTLYTDTIHFGVLPVNIVNLKAEQKGNFIKVEWTSLTEINVANYEIQHSADSRNFSTVGVLPARGNGTEQIRYAYNDTKPGKGDNFYRIKAVDNDGKLTYSNTVLVNMPNDRNITLAYPNPARNILNIQINSSASFSLLNQNGKTILTKTITNSAAIDVSHLAAGLYYLKNNNTGEVQKVIVEK